MLNNNTRSYQAQLKRFTTMEPRNPPQSTLDSAKPLPSRSASIGPRRPPQCEYPTSPQFFLGDKFLHFNHPQHHLLEMDSPDLFTCGGCKEYGSGKRFSCPQCDFQLHKFCALAPQSLLGHPFHIHHQLLLQTKPVYGGIRKSRCDACSKTIKGYNFRCSACSFQMHPCCAKLSNEVNFNSLHRHTLKLLPVTPSTSNGDQPGFVCGECRRKRPGRVYRCSVPTCDYHLHVACAKKMVNGLHANNIKDVDNKPNRFGVAARAASQVFSDFLGGLIEGLGEGFGEVLVTNMTRGKNTDNANR